MTTHSLQELSDREEIRSVLALFCRAVDRRDRELLRSLYHPDATDDHLVVSGPVDVFIDWAMGALSGATVTEHNLGTVIIALDGDVAYVESYYELLRGESAEDVEDGEYLVMSGGRYVDRFERRNDGPWLIANRVLMREWWRRDLIVGQGGVSYRRGSRDRNDPAYQRD
jgi:ketosteroid isomerase-like protein